jgi:hypothetical protein
MSAGGAYTLTASQVKIVKDRSDEEIFQSVNDHYIKRGVYPPKEEKILEAIEKAKRILNKKDLFILIDFPLSYLEKQVMKEYVHGSEWLDKAEEKYKNGEISGRQMGAEIRTFNNLIEKYKKVGLF